MIPNKVETSAKVQQQIVKVDKIKYSIWWQKRKLTVSQFFDLSDRFLEQSLKLLYNNNTTKFDDKLLYVRSMNNNYTRRQTNS